MTDVDEFLEHHGVKGMHWGVIRDNRQKAKDDRYNAAYSKELSELRDVAASYKNKYSTMSKSQLAAERDKISAKINKMDMDTVVAGLGNVAGHQKRINKQAQKRGDKTPFQLLTPAEKTAVTLKRLPAKKAKALTRSVVLGSLETAALVGGSNLLISKMNLSPAVKRKGQIQVTLALGGPAAYIKINELNAISQAAKYLTLTEQRGLIDRVKPKS